MTGAAAPVPVTILAGFLGAGKTTLLNRILSGDHGLRIAALVNDFGAINIDAALIERSDGEVVSLANGCICCSLSDGLLVTVMRLVRGPAPPQYIVIETSGLSDPFAVARTFADPELQPCALLDSIVTVVDAEQASALEGEMASLARCQVAAADLVLLNKIDLVDTRQRAAAVDWVRAISPAARVLEVAQARAPLELLLGVGRFAAREVCAHAHCGHAHDHGAQFDSWSYESDAPLPLAQLHAAMRGLPPTVFRVKGILYLQEKPEHRCVFQAVGQRATLTVDRPWGAQTPRNRLVFIGPRGGMPVDALRAQLPAAKHGDGTAAASWVE